MDMHNADTTSSVKTKPSRVNDKVEQSRLLSLPKELRLEIWRYVLTDPSMDEHVLRICGKNPGPNSSSKRFSNSLYKGTQTLQPQVQTVFEAPRAAPINVNLLRTNWLIYEEALPILYHSVKFCPWALGGFFPMFLEKLSPFAQSNIRYVKMYIQDETFNDWFAWAVTCAQVAKIDGSLRIVEVECDWPLPGSERRQRGLLYPLLKIKAQKKFVGSHDADFQHKLAEAAKELEAKAFMRRAFTAADAAARSKNGEPSNKKQRLQEVVTRTKPASAGHTPIAEDGDVARNLSTMSGIQESDKDLEEWDMVSVRSASPSRKRARTGSISDDDIWVDGASTIVAKEDGETTGEGSGDWELID